MAFGDGGGSTVEVEGSHVVSDADALADSEPAGRKEFFGGVQRIEVGVDDFGDPFKMVVEDAGEEGDEEGARCRFARAPPPRRSRRRPRAGRRA